MTDEGLLYKRLADIDGAVADLRRHAPGSAIGSDPVVTAFAERRLQVAIQAALDVAAHIVADGRLGAPTSNRELFSIIHQHGWLEGLELDSLLNMASFRNVLVHGYTEVDSSIVRDIIEHHLADLLHFAATIRSKLAALKLKR